MLADVAAKRAIVDLAEATGQPAIWEAAEHLAAVYADHPDYRQEWKP